MKDSEFIELLNLYIDHEISVEDAARLEAEVTANRERRQVYRQYCRIHRACGVLAGQFREDAPEATVTFRPSRHTWTGVAYAASLLAAAGFAVLVGVRQHRSAPAQAGALAVSAPAPVAVPVSAASAPAVVATAEPAGAQLHPVVDLRDLDLFAGDNARNVRLRFPAAPLAAEQNQINNDLLAWMNQVRMQPVQRPPLEQAFGGTPVLLESANREVQAPYGGQAQLETAAFRFER